MNYPNPRRSDLRIAALLFLGVSLGGCFASPDFSQITCKSDKQCAPGYPHCDLTINKCRAGLDGALPGEAGQFPVDVSNETGAGIDGSRLDQAVIDGVASESAAVDAWVTSDVPVPDVPGQIDLPSPDLERRSRRPRRLASRPCDSRGGARPRRLRFRAGPCPRHRARRRASRRSVHQGVRVRPGELRRRLLLRLPMHGRVSVVCTQPGHLQSG
jgi:hypothetical protein